MKLSLKWNITKILLNFRLFLTGIKKPYFFNQIVHFPGKAKKCLENGFSILFFA